MAHVELAPLRPGDRAPDFDLPAADHDGRVALAEYRRRGPVLLTMIRSLYCPFCRRHISQLKPTCDTLRAARVELLGIVIASAERARRYFTFGGRPCFPIGAAPDRALHRAYGLDEIVLTPESKAETQRLSADILRESGIESPLHKAIPTFIRAGGFELEAEDAVEMRRPLQTVGAFLIDPDGMIRWAKTAPIIVELPNADELASLL